MFIVSLCLSAFFFGYGIPSVFFKDTAWKIQKFENDISGRESKRTDSWEFFATIRGILMIFVGFAFIYFAFAYET